jgi:hypothetical protein
MFGANSSAHFNAGPLVSQQGWLIKQGGSRKTWRRRWFVLADSTLRWYEPGWFTLNPVDGTLKGEVRVSCPPKKRAGCLCNIAALGWRRWLTLYTPHLR